MGINVEELYRKYGPMVLRRCRSILRDEDRAMDAMQETFVKMIKGADRLDDRAPSSLLYTTATNVCLNMIRSDKRKPESSGDELLQNIAGIDDPESAAIGGHFLDRLFSREKESTRVMATLHYVDGLTLEETAIAVGLSVSGVRKRLRLLRERGLKLKEM